MDDSLSVMRPATELRGAKRHAENATAPHTALQAGGRRQLQTLPLGGSGEEARGCCARSSFVAKQERAAY